jgi:hypothetical protein
MELCHFWARGPPRPLCFNALIRKAEAETTRTAGRFLCCVSRASRSNVPVRRYHAYATRCKPTTA